MWWRRSPQRCMRAQKWEPSEHLPSGVDKHRGDAFNRGKSLTQQPHSLTSIPLNICNPGHPSRCYVQLQWYVPNATPLARTSNYVMSPRTSGSIYTPERHTVQLIPSSDPLTRLVVICLTAIYPALRSSRCSHVLFLPLNTTRVSFGTQPHR